MSNTLSPASLQITVSEIVMVMKFCDRMSQRFCTVEFNSLSPPMDNIISRKKNGKSIVTASY